MKWEVIGPIEGGCEDSVKIPKMQNKHHLEPVYGHEIKPVNPKGDQSWVFIGGTDVEAETPILWPPDEKS